MQVEIYFEGLVQGVNFRYYTQKTARSLGLVGFVRNLPDGRVHAVVSGPEEVVRRFLDWARVGPPSARVDRMDVRELPGEGGEFADFEIRYG
ncbi:MAG: acylphosphatase [candidate division WOR-3 bacterium]